MLQEFKKFAMKGNVVDLAIGVIIGGAFGKRRNRRHLRLLLSLQMKKGC